MRFLLLAAATAVVWAQQPGLLLTVRDGRHEVALRAPSPNFFLESNESLHPAIEPAFQAEFSGTISVLQAGEYTFDSGKAGLLIGGKPVTQPLSLNSGPHSIVIRYRRSAGAASLQLRWKSAAFDWEPVPPSAFSTSAAPEADEGRRL
ncbi:MAG: hypothetical protein SFV51_30730, partial [Bryobacteraceae bacterium]|nr:hypothetical protein [Bryobacteraceae bacterium]